MSANRFGEKTEKLQEKRKFLIKYLQIFWGNVFMQNKTQKVPLL